MRNLHLSALAASSIAIAAAVASPAYAQETTSSITGQVTNDAGAALGGARIVVVHTPSGTRAATTTDASGSYVLRGLRVGGPYVVHVEAAGWAPETIEGISLLVGEALALPVHMAQHEIVVFWIVIEEELIQVSGREVSLRIGSEGTMFPVQRIRHAPSSVPFFSRCLI